MTGFIVDSWPEPVSDRRCHAANPWEGRAPTWYRERIWHTAAGLVVLVTEIGDNPGMSITNNAENIWRQIRQQWSYALVVEHYDRRSYPGGRNLPESFDLVDMVGGRVRWTSVEPGWVAEQIALSVPSKEPQR